jgi:hypothetical protein
MQTRSAGILSLLFVLECLAPEKAASETAPLPRVATFQCDITPPLGEPMLWATKLTKVEQPLLAKGVLLEDGTNRYVLCALDWCLVGNDTELSFRQTLANAAHTDAGRVAVQCLHQHAAPYADEQAYRLLDAAPSPLSHLSSNFMATVRRNLSNAVTKAAVQLQPFDQIGSGQAKAERVASIRRLKDDKGKPLTRYSSTAKTPKLAEAPEGPIDPYLKTITFAKSGKPLVRLHYYATHPQTFCCDGRASWDFVGNAREELQREENVFQIYFTGCAGDVTVGKYNDGSPEAMAGLGQRLKKAMADSDAETTYAPVTTLLWRTNAFVMPLRGDKGAVVAQSQAWLDTPTQGESFRVYEGAMRIAFVERLERPVQVSSLQMGKVHILNLPGEPMVEYQQFAQRAAPGDFVAVAGYGDCGTAYICTDAALDEGGYEPGASNVGKGSEDILKNAIKALLH